MYVKSRRLPTPLIGALGVFLGLVIVVVFAGPRVTAFSPAPGSEQVPARSPIRITFNRSMDITSVEARFRVEPQVAGRFRWEGNRLIYQPLEPWPQGERVEVRLVAGARSARFLPILRTQRWAFTVGEPRVAYLWPTGRPADLYARTLDGRETTRLTETPWGVLDFRLSEDGSGVVYAAQRDDGGTDIRLLDLTDGSDELLYGCAAETQCLAPALSPDGDLLAFEHATMVVEISGSPAPSPSAVWALRLGSEGEAFPISPQDHAGFSPTWSPSGELAYYDETLQAVAIVDTRSGPEPLPFQYIPSGLGLVGTWSPDGSHLVYPEIAFTDTESSGGQGDEGGSEPVFFSHLYRVEVATGEAVDLSGSGEPLVEDSSPVYSPDGAWIAFARKFLESERWTLGRQAWLMRPDGSEAHQLTDAPEFNYAAFSWSPDSSAIVALRFNPGDINQPGEIWLIDLEGGEPRRLVVGGFLPQWIP